MKTWCAIAVVFGVSLAAADARAAAVYIASPTEGQLIRGEAVPVSVGVPNGFTIAPEMDGRALALTPAWGPSGDGTYRYSAEVSGITHGLDKQLTVAATELATGTKTVLTVHFRFDRVPVLTIVEPLPFTVVRAPARVHLRGRCQDFLVPACPGLAVNIGFGFDDWRAQPTVAGGQFEVDIDLSDQRGNRFELLVASADLALKARSVHPLYVEDSAALTEVVTTGGQVMGLDHGRVLELDAAGVKRGNDLLAAPGSNERWLDGVGYLRGDTAIFAVRTGGGPARAFEWRGGGLTTLSEPLAHGWVYSFPGNRYALLEGAVAHARRDLVSGANMPVAVGGGSPSLAPNGDVVFETTGSAGGPARLWRWREGNITMVADEGFGAGLLSGRSDGINIAYTARDDRIVLLTAGGQVVLGGTPAGGMGYGLEGGWTGFLGPDARGTRQVWTRARDGTIRQVTDLPAGAEAERLEAVTAEGQVLFTAAGRRFLTRTPAEPLAVGSTLGQPVRFDGQWYLLLGRTLFSFGPPGTPFAAGGTDAGVTDAGAGAGAADAGAPADAAAPPVSTVPSAPRRRAAGGGCAVAGDGAPAAAWLALIAIAFAWRGRRLRRGCYDSPPS